VFAENVEAGDMFFKPSNSSTKKKSPEGLDFIIESENASTPSWCGEELKRRAPNVSIIFD